MDVCFGVAGIVSVTLACFWSSPSIDTVLETTLAEMVLVCDWSFFFLSFDFLAGISFVHSWISLGQ
jgi:hypothetical protein